MLIIPAAFILDYFIGDPQSPLHPIRVIGSGVDWGVKGYKKANSKSPLIQFAMGAVLTSITVCLSFFATKLAIGVLYTTQYWIGLAAEAVVCCFLIAPRSLQEESMKVYRDLDAGDIDGARKSLSFIVGRDTRNLSKEDIVRGAVETVAENLSDGVIAPLLFICLGGAPAGMAYKAINTLDSMIGYRNEENEYFGKFAARLDDVVNFFPARISALLMILGSAIIGANAKAGARIFLRDRYKHKSPNSAQTESVCAGALGLRLGGDNYYHGELVHKPMIGDDIVKPEAAHIRTANRLMYTTVVCAVFLLTAGYIAAALSRGYSYVCV